MKLLSVKLVGAIIISFLFFSLIPVFSAEEGAQGGGKVWTFAEKHASLDVVSSYSFTKKGESRNYFLIQPPPISPSSNSEESPLAEPPSWFSKTIQGGGTKKFRHLVLTVDVYDQEFSKITREEDGGQFTAYCRMDFNKLKHLDHIETDSAIYSLSCWVSNWSSEALASMKQLLEEQGIDIPLEEMPSAFEEWKEEQDDYFYAGEQEDSIPENLEAFDLLHQIYTDLPESLPFEQNQALETASSQPTASTPPRSQTIYFWPKKNSRYLKP